MTRVRSIAVMSIWYRACTAARRAALRAEAWRGEPLRGEALRLAAPREDAVPPFWSLPVIGSAPARRGEMLLELHQIEAGAGGVAALVAPLDIGARPSLLAAVAGQNTVADWHGMLDGECMQAGRGFPRHDLVMGRL